MNQYTKGQLLQQLGHLSHVWLCVTPETAAHQASQSLGFSRQEHWSGLPFPSPMHESEKWKWSRSVVSDSSQPHGPQPTRLLHPWDFPGKSTGVGCHCLLCSKCYGSLMWSHLNLKHMQVKSVGISAAFTQWHWIRHFLKPSWRYSESYCINHVFNFCILWLFDIWGLY